MVRIQVPKKSNPRQGTVLLLVVVVIVILSLISYQYTDFMMTESRGAENAVRALQLQAAVDSGIDYTAALLSNPNLLTNPYLDEESFHAVIVHESNLTREQSRFSILSALPPGVAGANDLSFRFGVADESGKINLNAMMKKDPSGEELYKLLINLNLPTLNEETVNAILDWLDEDGEPRQGGAENETYSSMDPPYACKNGPLDSLDELLLVRGITPEILYGSDLNRNGMIDANEPSVDPLTDLGLVQYFTIYSREQNIASSGYPRINLNQQDLTLLSQELTEVVGQDLANYIILARIYGTQPGSSSSGSASLSQALTDNKVNLQFGGRKKIKSLYELINSTVTISSGRGRNSRRKVYASPLNDRSGQEQFLPALFDTTTVSKETDLPARVNINTAPEGVLYAFEDLDLEEIQQILARRPSMDSPNFLSPVYQSPTWLITEAEIDPETLQKLEPYITTRSQVYRFQVVSYFDEGGPWARVEAIVDTNAGRPRVLFRRDLTVFGKGFIISINSGR